MLSGSRKIYNVMYSNQVIDLDSGGTAEGTHINGYVNADYINENQRWDVQVLDADKEGNNITVRIVNNGTGKYMRAEPETLNQGVFASDTATKWTLVKQNKIGQYKIQGQEGDLVCALKSGENFTQITLAVPDNSDSSQLWVLVDL